MIILITYNVRIISLFNKNLLRISFSKFQNIDTIYIPLYLNYFIYIIYYFIYIIIFYLNN